MMSDLFFAGQDAGYAAALGNLMFAMIILGICSLAILRRKRWIYNQKILAYLAAFFICIVHLVPFTCWSTLQLNLAGHQFQMFPPQYLGVLLGCGNAWLAR
jgi:hypothetical protein